MRPLHFGGSREEYILVAPERSLSGCGGVLGAIRSSNELTTNSDALIQRDLAGELSLGIKSLRKDCVWCARRRKIEQSESIPSKKGQ